MPSIPSPEKHKSSPFGNTVVVTTKALLGIASFYSAVSNGVELASALRVGRMDVVPGDAFNILTQGAFTLLVAKSIWKKGHKS